MQLKKVSYFITKLPSWKLNNIKRSTELYDIPMRRLSLMKSSIALPRKIWGRINDDINTTGAKIQRNEPLSSWNGADINFPSSTSWWVSPQNDTEPDFPRNGSAPLKIVTGKLEFSLELTPNFVSESALDAHTIAPLFELHAKYPSILCFKSGKVFPKIDKDQLLPQFPNPPDNKLRLKMEIVHLYAFPNRMLWLLEPNWFPEGETLNEDRNEESEF